MKCKSCDNIVKDILKHLLKSKPCQEVYDVEQIRQSKRQERLEKKKKWSREKYERNRDEILQKREAHYKVNKESIRLARAEYYSKNTESIRVAKDEYYSNNMESIRVAKAEYYCKNKESIRVAQAEYFKRSRSLSCQRKRFHKHFKHEDALNYLTGHQEHLYHHTKGICQSETLLEFNHSVEYYDGLCNFCTERQGVKLAGINRQVCLGCNRAKCTKCDSETSPNPEFGCLHYSPDMGSQLGFIPGHCPLYSNPHFPRYSDLICITNQHACKLCNEVNEDYPEYSLFGELKSESCVSGTTVSRKDVFVYTCNLCGNKFDFVCEFDLHMRSHTKWGKSVAVIALGTSFDQEHLDNDRVTEENFLIIEKELMKAEGISAVLTIFKKKRFEKFFKKENLEDVNLVATLLLKEGVDINDELKSVSIDHQIIENIVVVEVRSHFVTDHSVWACYEPGYHVRKRFEELLRWEDRPSVMELYPVSDSRWYRRNTALLSSRCSLVCPGEDRYKGLPETSPPDFSSHVLHFLWRLVKHSDLCCCVSKFYCSTSTDLEKCKQGCCGKCEEEKLSGLDIDLSGTEADEMTENEDEEDIDSEEESEEVVENEEEGEDDSETNDGDWWDDQ